MKHIKPLLYDFKLQFRGGFYFAYIFVTILYIAFLRVIPENIKDIFAIFIVYSDPSVITFYFAAAILLLEKNERTLDSVFITPVSINNYLMNKVVSLAFISLFTSFIIITFTYGLNYNPIMLFIPVFLSSTFYTLAGIAIATKSATINTFLYPSIVFITIFTIPAINFIPQVNIPIFEYTPSMCTIRLLSYSLGYKYTASDIIINIGYSFIMIILAFAFAHRRFEKYIIEKIGG